MTASNEQQMAVIGGGLMGYGIAFIFASAGYHVNIVEPDAQRRKDLPNRITGLCDLLERPTQLLDNINYHKAIQSAVREAELVIEAAPENLAIKQSIFTELDRQAPSEAILATNTSAIPISKIADATQNPRRVVGAHFWNPPHLMELVEIILGTDSDRAIGDRAHEILSSVGMTPVMVFKDVPGFIGNRLQHALKREAIALVANGICDAETVDTVTKLGFGARLPVMGPLEQSDLLGLELTVAIHNTLMPDLDVTPTVHPYLRNLIKNGKSGAKVGEGFRTWTEAEATATRDKMNHYLIARARERYAKLEDNVAHRSGGSSR